MITSDGSPYSCAAGAGKRKSRARPAGREGKNRSLPPGFFFIKKTEND